jgi:beta-galactosidase
MCKKHHLNAMRIALIIFSAVACLPPVRSAKANSNMFPPLSPARPYIHFDGRGFIINGKRTFICSGSFHYARVPEKLWRNRLLKMKRAGFNTVQTYVFWNFQEPKKNVFNWKGRADLSHFLDLVHQMGMYALVRCGPYDCAEWDSGGYPVWLEFIPHLVVRHNDPPFMRQVTKFWHQLLPIVAAHQINRGGPVILVQLENEDSAGWGTDMPTAYYRHLLRIAREEGIVVPTFFSGMHHSFDPAGRRPWNDANRISPWYTTEFWSSPTWYQGYGAMTPTQQMQVNRGIWKIIAFGGAGYNFYMLVGSTNFGMWNDNELAAGYDYSAAIGQAGDLRPIYFQMKRANYFARSFQDILSNSVNADRAYADFASGVRVLARKGPAGTVVFLDNAGASVARATLHHGLRLKLQPREILPIVLNSQLGHGFGITEAANRILGIESSGPVTTLVVYGHSGASVHMLFHADGRPILHGSLQMAGSKKGLFTLSSTARFSKHPTVSTAKLGAYVLRVIVESTGDADRTWFVHSPAGPLVVEGPAYAGKVTGTPTSMHMYCSAPIHAGATSAMAWGQKSAPIHFQMLAFMTRRPDAPALSSWQYRTLTAPAEITFNDSHWLTTRTPRPMGYDGRTTTAWCWYRANVDAPHGGHYQITLSHYADAARAFINGKPAAMSFNTIRAHLHAGRNILAIFTAEYGRSKVYNYYGKINTVLAKGLWGPVYLTNGVSTPITRWRVIPMGNSLTADEHQIEHHGVKFSRGTGVKTGTDYFRGRAGYAAYSATLTAPGNVPPTLQFSDVDDNGWIFINGHLAGSHRGWGERFSIHTGRFWKPGSKNRIVVLVQNIAGAGGVMGTAELNTASFRRPVIGWRMRGGIRSADGRKPWQSISKMGTVPLPRLYRAEFNWQAGGEVGWHMVLRAEWGNLDRGHIYVNGHDLGLYPDRNVPEAGGLYIPSVWLHSGVNQIEMFDVDGRSPQGVKIAIDPVASRLRWMLVSHGS